MESRGELSSIQRRGYLVNEQHCFRFCKYLTVVLVADTADGISGDRRTRTGRLHGRHGFFRFHFLFGGKGGRWLLFKTPRRIFKKNQELKISDNPGEATRN